MELGTHFQFGGITGGLRFTSGRHPDPVLEEGARFRHRFHPVTHFLFQKPYNRSVLLRGLGRVDHGECLLPGRVRCGSGSIASGHDLCVLVPKGLVGCVEPGDLGISAYRGSSGHEPPIEDWFSGSGRFLGLSEGDVRIPVGGFIFLAAIHF